MGWLMSKRVPPKHGTRMAVFLPVKWQPETLHEWQLTWQRTWPALQAHEGVGASQDGQPLLVVAELPGPLHIWQLQNLQAPTSWL